jgi:hypothetical protein
MWENCSHRGVDPDRNRIPKVYAACQQGTIDQALALNTNLLPCAAQRQQGCATIVPCRTAAPSQKR